MHFKLITNIFKQKRRLRDFQTIKRTHLWKLKNFLVRVSQNDTTIFLTIWELIATVILCIGKVSRLCKCLTQLLCFVFFLVRTNYVCHTNKAKKSQASHFLCVPHILFKCLCERVCLSVSQGWCWWLSAMKAHWWSCVWALLCVTADVFGWEGESAFLKMKKENNIVQKDI